MRIEELPAQLKGAILLQKQGDPAGALELFDGWLEAHPGDELATYWSASCLYRLGRLEEAVYRARRVGPGPHQWAALIVESDGLVKLGHLAEARQAAEQLALIAADKPSVHTRLAWIGVRTQDAELTLRAGRRAVELAPSSTEALFLLAMGHSMSAQVREARWVLRRLFELDPKDERGLVLMKQLKRRSR